MLLFLYILDHQIYTPRIVHFPKNTYTSQLSSLFPMGWAFFTKDPRKLRTPRVWDNGEEWSDHQGSPAYAFGFDRTYRLRQSDLYAVLTQTREDRMALCTAGESSKTCAKRAKEVVLNKASRWLRCKHTYVVQVTEPIPWAWRHKIREGQSRAVSIKVSC